jgi:hypothetical protein
MAAVRISEGSALASRLLKAATSQPARSTAEKCLGCPHDIGDHLQAVEVRNGGGVEVGSCSECSCDGMKRKDF